VVALAPVIAALRFAAVGASIGTDGIDGPTDAAGGMVDAGSMNRALSEGLHWQAYVDNNDTYALLKATGDLVTLGPTGTNVGDVQVTLVGQ
jgi:hydroxypyruvate reductase